MAAERFVGLISGTSRDGIDAALLRLDGDDMIVEQALTRPFPPNLAEALRRLPTHRPPSDKLRQRLDAVLAERFAATALALLRQARVDPGDVAAIGSHGQTIWHAPDADPPLTVQAGDGSEIARRTGITTVSDFRAADVAAGGEGAPLAPLLHLARFHEDGESRAVLNLGGIANLTLLTPFGGVSGFDTGPANCLMDGWIRQHRGLPYDEEGAWAARGQVIRPLLERLMEDPFFAEPPPKSTGIETFNAGWLAPHVKAGWKPEDVQATLLQLTVETVVQALDANTRARPARLLVCGGGAQNRRLMDTLAGRLSGTIVEPTSRWGIDPDYVEAALFAWLARERLAGRKQDTTSITGAQEAVLLGEVHSPP